MKVNFYSVYDTKMEIFAPPFISVNDAVGIRNFGDMAKSDQWPYKAHPKDYILFWVGCWDDHTGEVLNVKPKNLGPLPLEELEVLNEK